MDAQAAYSALIEHWRSIAPLESTGSLLGWDQECMLPEAGGAWRAEQQAALAGLVHQRRSDPRLADWLDLAAGLQDDSAAANLRYIGRAYRQATRLPSGLVEATARQQGLCYEAWKQARAADDFGFFASPLASLLELVRETADHLRDEGQSRYQSLLDQYEPEADPAVVERLLEELGRELPPRIQAWRQDSPRRLPAGDYSLAEQQRLCQEVLATIGFDFSAGRLDTALHPFCSTLGPRDVRLTTRYRPDDPLDALSSCLHEGGHGLYEQGLPEEHFGLPTGEAISLGIHESQSRLYENHVGRSPAFARHLAARLAEFFPHLQGLSAETLTAVQNQVLPGYIRVDADEVCYDLHIVLRYRLEQRLIEGQLAVTELPAAWNQEFQELFDLPVHQDRDGCLQDVHWAHGAFGYFPTYSLGNAYAAQFFQAARRALPQLDAQLAAGELLPLRDWLRAQVHIHGHRGNAAALCRQVSGKELSAAPLLAHLDARYRR